MDQRINANREPICREALDPTARAPAGERDKAPNPKASLGRRPKLPARSGCRGARGELRLPSNMPGSSRPKLSARSRMGSSRSPRTGWRVRDRSSRQGPGWGARGELRLPSNITRPVRTKGLEPLQEFPRQNLNLVRLPIPPRSRVDGAAPRILPAGRIVKAGSRPTAPYRLCSRADRAIFEAPCIYAPPP